jgi:pyridoxamine 5'-phosphate oxidase family protein
MAHIVYCKYSTSSQYSAWLPATTLRVEEEVRMSFNDEEIAYLRSQPLARIATVSADGQPDVVPVGYEFDGSHLYVGGLDPAKTRKFLNVQAGNSKVALVVDDLVSTQPWTPRYLRIYGTAELVERQGRFGPAPYMRIAPTMSWSWNLEGRPFTHDREVVVRRTLHEPTPEPGGV